MVFSTNLFSLEVSLKEAEHIGKKIFFNECGDKEEKLVWWNEGENFVSLGIGHFIWYPEGKNGPFEETFPSLLDFLSRHHENLPKWLKENKGCPWNSKQEFSEASQTDKKQELQSFLLNTVSLQAVFIIQRLERTIPKLFSDFPDEKKYLLLKKVESLFQIPQGKYALIDYLNFKGDGTSEKEKYCGQGWGLKQVLEEMSTAEKDPLTAFSDAATTVIKRRVQNSPPERHEERWLQGWLNRIASYARSGLT